MLKIYYEDTYVYIYIYISTYIFVSINFISGQRYMNAHINIFCDINCYFHLFSYIYIHIDIHIHMYIHGKARFFHLFNVPAGLISMYALCPGLKRPGQSRSSGALLFMRWSRRRSLDLGWIDHLGKDQTTKL